ncbi:hypothetical protein Bbelb_370260 [Branchiostoma belcheri]|nr:hypothetical protein Bbelb_370260 [Branchiostoma belcheri]
MASVGPDCDCSESLFRQEESGRKRVSGADGVKEPTMKTGAVLASVFTAFLLIMAATTTAQESSFNCGLLGVGKSRGRLVGSWCSVFRYVDGQLVFLCNSERLAHALGRSIRHGWQRNTSRTLLAYSRTPDERQPTLQNTPECLKHFETSSWRSRTVAKFAKRQPNASRTSPLLMDLS